MAGDSTPANDTSPTVKPNDATKPSIPLLSLNGTSWPSTLILDRSAQNWAEWSQQLDDILGTSGGLWRYPLGKVPKPDAATEPRACSNWEDNDRSVLSFMRMKVSGSEREYIRKSATSKDAYDTLRDRHEKQGALTQVLLMHEAFAVRYSRDVPFSTTTAEIQRLNDRIWAAGNTVNTDNFCAILMLNALSGDLVNVRNAVSDTLASGTCSPDSISKRLDTEQSIISRDKAAPTVLAARSSSSPPQRQREICPNCHRAGHSTEYCVAAGGGMAGRTISESIEARRAAKGGKMKISGSTGPSSGNGGSMKGSSPQILQTTQGDSCMVVDGKIYFLNSKPSQPPTTSSFAGLATDPITSIPAHLLSPGDQFEHHVWMLMDSASHLTANVDWRQHSRPVDYAHVTIAPPDTQGHTPLSLTDYPWFLDTGAELHISPERFDFLDLRPIARRTVRGVGGSTINAVGIGTIQLNVGPALKLELENVLYIPEATVRLISVLDMNRQNMFVSHFDHEKCWITNRHNSVVARGTVTQNRKLYSLVLSDLSTTNHAFLSSRIPSLDTWHQRLGHANYRTVLDMARHGSAEGKASQEPSS